MFLGEKSFSGVHPHGLFRELLIWVREGIIYNSLYMYILLTNLPE